MICRCHMKGFMVECDDSMRRHLTAFEEITEYSGRKGQKLRKKKREVDYPMYEHAGPGRILTTLPCVLFLVTRHPLLTVKWTSPPMIPTPLDFTGLQEYFEPRDYQQESMVIAATARCGYISASVAAGKTEILLGLAFAAAKLHNVMFVGPTKVVMRNFRKRAEKYGLPFQFLEYADLREQTISRKGNIIITNPVAVCNDLTKATLPKCLGTVGTLLTDEAHNFEGRTTWMTLFKCLPRLERSYGVSGTLTRYSANSHSFTGMEKAQANLVSACGNILVEKTVEELKDYIDPPDVINYRWDWPRNHEGVMKINHWHDISKAIQTFNERMEIIAKISRLLSARGIRHIIPVSKKKSGELLLDRLPPGTVCWYGGGKIFDRHRVKIDEDTLRAGIDSGQYTCIIATFHLDQGADVPDITAILMTEGRSDIAIIQRAGRAARKSHTKSFIVNFWENQDILGYQAEVRESYVRNYFDTSGCEVRSIRALNMHLDELLAPQVEPA